MSTEHKTDHNRDPRNKNKWGEMGEDILNSVFQAVETGNFTGLSDNISTLVGEAADSISRGADQVSREISRQMKDRGRQNADIYRQRAREHANNWKARTYHQSYGQRVRETVQNGWQQARQVPARYRSYLPGQTAGPLCIGLGVTGMVLFGSAAITTAIIAACSSLVWGVPVGLGIATLPFIGLTAKGAGLNGRNSRFRRYVRTIGDRGYCKIEDLAGAIGKRSSYVRKDLQDMLRKGYFLQGHMDSTQTTLIVDQETYRQYEEAEQARARREAEAAECPDEVRTILSEGEAYIAHIRECNDAIPGEEISAKLDQLENVMRRIFDQVKKDPDSAQELHKLMTYYLPTTTKLIDAYRDLDGQPEYGENIANTKKEIESTLDTINEAFENLFDSLFEDTAWDISSDISAMKVMLQQEGLTNQEDFK